MPHDPEVAVVSWLHTQQNWLQETALRILDKGILEDSDIHKVAEYLKTQEGQQISSTRSFPGISREPTGSSIHLDCICEVKGVDNLNPHSPLEFGKGNLTVVYGNNGSGKSGYTRILKKAFGKSNAVALKPNVFQAVPTEQHCVIRYSIDGETKNVKWLVNAPAIDGLKDIDIFDSLSGKLYLNEETEANYTPPLIALFEGLVDASNQINKQLTKEEEQLVSHLPHIADRFKTTIAGKTYLGLNSTHSEASLASILIWEDENEQAKKSLIERLATKNPSDLAKTLKQQKQQIDQLVSTLEKATSTLSKESCKKILLLKKDAVEKRKIAEDGAKAQASQAKLDGIGSETWRAMWQAARSYSIEHAYPEQIFPNTEEAALCVLCHQTLSLDAKQRMKDFDSYIQGELELTAKKAEETYNVIIQALAVAPSEESMTSMIQAAGLDVEEWKQPVLENWKSISAKTIELSNITGEDVGGIELPYPTMVETLRTYGKDLETSALQYEEDAKSFNREEAEEALLQLKAKEWTSQQADAIKTELLRLKNLAKIEDWKRLTNTTAISRKVGELSTTLITDAYIHRFNDELAKLGATKIKATLSKTGTRQGVVKHKIHLQGLDPRASVAEILSEGEQRIVSLAAFLADVTGKILPVPFIFDDPISSLDQDFEFLVALRLGHLAKDRQVVVFTHRLSLFGALEDVAKKISDKWKQKNLYQVSIESFAGSAGHPTNKAIWMKNTTDANNILLEKMKEAETILAEQGIVTYKIYAQALCSDFRKLIERTVEDNLLNQIVRRHRRSVTTDNRLRELPKIDKSDCVFIDNLMTKYSTYEHSQSSETPVFLPDPEDLRKDIEDLKAWRDEFKKRHSESLT